jgi:hypothetical protein
VRRQSSGESQAGGSPTRAVAPPNPTLALNASSPAGLAEEAAAPHRLRHRILHHRTISFRLHPRTGRAPATARATAANASECQTVRLRRKVRARCGRRARAHPHRGGRPRPRALLGQRARLRRPEARRAPALRAVARVITRTARRKARRVVRVVGLVVTFGGGFGSSGSSSRGDSGRTLRSGGGSAAPGQRNESVGHQRSANILASRA